MRINKDNYKKAYPSGASVQAVQCKNGLLTLSVSKGGLNRLIHSKYDPEEEARKAIEIAREIIKIPVIIVFGLGMGFHIREILKLAPSGTVIHIFEPCSEALGIFFENGGEALLRDERIKLYAASDKNGLSPEGIFSLQNCDAFTFYAHPVYADIFREEHNAFVQKINAEKTRLLVQKNTIRAFGKRWSINFLENYRCLGESAAVKGLFGIFKGKTAVIVSAGPSLSKNVSEVKDVKGKAVIICCDTAYKALAAIDIEPDILVSTSGSRWAAEKLKGVTYDFPLVYKSQTSNVIVRLHTGKKFYSRYINDFLDEALLASGIDAGFVDSGGSVACTCLDLSVKSGAKSVILLGQDFALTGGKVYAEHTTSPYTEEKMNQYIIETKDIYGKTVKTLQNLNSYRLWFEEYIKAHPEVRFIDATEGGALIAGTEIVTFSEARKKLKLNQFDIEERIARAYEENSLKGAKEEAELRYKQAYEDFLKAKELVNSILGEYEAGEISRETAECAANTLLELTRAVKYSIYTDILDIKNACVNGVPNVYYFKKIAGVLDRLTKPFEKPWRVEKYVQG